MLGDAAGVVHVVVRAASMLGGAVILQLRQAALIPELHGEADDGLRAVVEDGGDRGAVHAAAHGYGDGVRWQRMGSRFRVRVGLETTTVWSFSFVKSMK